MTSRPRNREPRRSAKLRAPARRAPVRIPVVIEEHTPSRHVVAQSVSVFAQVPADVTTSKKIQARANSAAFYFSHVTILSIGWVLWRIVRRIAVTVFWLPVNQPRRKPERSASLRLPEVAMPPVQVPQRVRQARVPLSWQRPQLPIISWPKWLVRAPRVHLPRIPAIRFRSGFHFDGSIVASTLQFAAIAIVLVVPIWATGRVAALTATAAEIQASALSGANAFIDGATLLESSSYLVAGSHFSISARSFAKASEELRALPPVLRLAATSYGVGATYETAESLLAVARQIAQAGYDIATILGDEALGDDSQERSLAALLFGISGEASEILPLASRAVNDLLAVDVEKLPAAYQDVFAELRQAILPPLAALLTELPLVMEHVPAMLGEDGPRRYLLIFQNDGELRATGGFMGSFALVDIRNGEVERLEFPTGGTYDVQGQLDVRLRAPEPLRLVNARWEFQDANWWPDWPTSAQALQWLYEHAGGGSVDGVIAFDTEFMSQLLGVTGPVVVPSYGTITRENFVDVIQQEVERRDRPAGEKPKQILADFAPLLLAELRKVPTNRSGELAAVVRQALLEKHVLVSSSSEREQMALNELGWSGALGRTRYGEDAVAVVHSNIGGQKSDRVIDDALQHEVVVESDGTMTVKLTVTRHHRGEKGQAFTGVRNVDYIRVYVPRGSRLLAASGGTPPDPDLFDAIDPTLTSSDTFLPVSLEPQQRSLDGAVSYEELDRTVFANWLMVDPGETAELSFMYRLPWRFATQTSGVGAWISHFANDEPQPVYRVRFEKQAGQTALAVTHRLTSANGTLRALGKEVEALSNGWQVSRTITSDTFIDIPYATQTP